MAEQGGAEHAAQSEGERSRNKYFINYCQKVIGGKFTFQADLLPQVAGKLGLVPDHAATFAQVKILRVVEVPARFMRLPLAWLS